MQFSKEAFIRLAIECGVLKFGEFTLKSGRTSPYFFNAGLFYQGNHLRALGRFYARRLIDNQITLDHLFGPAYKGIPLATATAIALAEQNINVTVTYNRKEAKDHGEGGTLIGAPLKKETVIVDDVITAGTAFREAQKIIKEQGAHLKGVIVALDRCERGQTNQSALDNIRDQGIKVLSIISFHDLIAYLQQQSETHRAERMQEYYQAHGC